MNEIKLADDGVALLSSTAPTAKPMSEAERAARMELAAFYRAVHLFGWSEITSNHITLRVPGEPEHFLINPFGLSYDEVTASSLVKVDYDGNLAAPTDHPINLAGYVIHSAVHQARHDAACVIHTHTIADNAVSAQSCGLLALNQTNALFYGAVASHKFEGPAVSLDERTRLQADLGDKPVMILKNHGMLAVGNTVAEAFLLTFYFQRACQMQVATLSGGVPYEVIDPAVAMQTSQAFVKFRQSSNPLDWLAVKRKLERIDPGYRD